MVNHPVPKQELLLLVLKEGRRRILPLAALFSIAALATLVVGLYLPKKYSSSATILVEPRSTTVTPGTPAAEAPRMAVVNQIITSKKVLRELATLGGWGLHSDPQAEARLFTQLRSRISINTSGSAPNGPTLVTITYSDSEPERALAIAKKLADVYIRESVLPEEATSRFNFAFVDGQVKEYAKTLAAIHDQVKAYEGREAAAPQLSGTPSSPSAPRANRVSVSDEELFALRQEETTLTAGLARTREPVSAELVQAENRYQERVLQLQGELNRLLATYTEEHPDARRVRGELLRAQKDVARAKADREHAQMTATAMENDIKRASRARLEEVQKRIAAITGDRPRSRRPSAPMGASPSARSNLPGSRLTLDTTAGATDPEMRSIRQDAAIAELLRSYQATQDIYQELLRRREQQRVTMELAEQRGLRLQIQEPPELPATPVSIRLMHVVAAGLLVATFLPIGLVVALVMLDGRVRSAALLEANCNLPVLVRIPHAPSAREKRRSRLHAVMAGALVAFVFIAYAAFFYLRRTT